MKVCAIIVTRNRLKCLKHCLAEVRGQDRSVDEIIVVDNDSNDGTKDWLQSQKDIVLIHQKNKGGAGGFRTGIAVGLDHHNDWLWCMDDDGYPEQSSLKHLSSHCDAKFSALNSVTVSPDNPDKLSFGMPSLTKTGMPKLQPAIRSLLELQKKVDKEGLVEFGSFFNGTLLNAEIVKQAGNVNSEMFIWGDELDLAWRMQRIAPIYTVLAAIHYHPEASGLLKPWKFYYRIRNGIYVTNRHLNHRFLRNTILLLRGLGYILRRPTAFPLFARAVRDGFSARLGATILPS